MESPLRLIDKPAGITSFDVIRRLREQFRAAGQKPPKLGHAGTLDPAASGLLIVGVGRDGTKLLNGLSGLDKSYEVTVKLGERTDTGDADGVVLERTRVDPVPSEEWVRAILNDMIGRLVLPVPVYSAVKVDGEPLYKKARRGKRVEPPQREMQVNDLVYRDLYTQDSEVYIEVTMDVASGVFVRSVVEEIGRRLGYPATTVALRRTRVGEYTVDEAEVIE